MFKHVLLPTDGSPSSENAIKQCVQLAKALGARVSGIHVVPEFHVFTYKTEMVEDTAEQYLKDSAAHAKQYLEVIATAAQDAEIPCETSHVISDHPYEAIIAAAEEKGCDLIVMATHGRKGVKGLLLGSETQKVLIHTRIPVLVYH